jgi:hypothetical protein
MTAFCYFHKSFAKSMAIVHISYDFFKVPFFAVIAVIMTLWLHRAFVGLF